MKIDRIERKTKVVKMIFDLEVATLELKRNPNKLVISIRKKEHKREMKKIITKKKNRIHVKDRAVV